jgi:hypothetical protein
MHRSPLTLLPVVALVACAPRTTFNYTVPATYSLPEGVQLLATVDSPETRESDAALDTMIDVLTDCARVKTVPAAGARAAFAEHPVARGAPLPPLAVQAISTASKTSGLLVLDRVENVSQVDVRETVKVENRIERRRPAGCSTCEPREEEVQVERPWFDAVSTHTVTLGWQIYGANGDVLTSWSTSETYVTHGEGESASMARENLDEAPELLRAAAEDAAFEASKHICPWTNSATRRYFRCGSDEVRAGARLARDGRWEDAKGVWESGTKDGSVSARGKAYLDLAVAYEREGKVGKALKNAEEAAKLLDKGWVDAYVVELRSRSKQQKRLKEQMDRVKDAGTTSPPAGK